MAKLNVFILSIFIVVASSLSSLSHGLILNGLEIGNLQIKGILRCTLNANLNAPPVSGQTVFFQCAGSSSTLGQAVTDAAGLFNIIVKILDSTAFDPSTCFVKVILPVATCSLFTPDGILKATVSLVNVLQTGNGNTANYIAGDFVRSIF